MLIAITRKVSAGLANCQLSYIARQAIDLEKARGQHQAYEDLLGRLGVRVVSLPEEPDLPDSVFVEDPAVVLDEIAVICPLGTEARRKETPSIAAALEKYRKLAYVKLPGLLEGGDVLRIGKKVFVGVTKRSNPEGIRQLAVIVGRFGYEVTAVPVRECLHLKSGVSYLGRDTMLANRAWFDAPRSAGFEWLEVDPAEPHGGNVLVVGDTVVVAASFPKTRARIEASGFKVVSLDISELQKAESGLTCSSLIFEG